MANSKKRRNSATSKIDIRKTIYLVAHNTWEEIMRIIKVIEDNSITHLIRAYGVANVAKKIGVSTSLISQALRNKCCISEESYLKIKEIFKGGG